MFRYRSDEFFRLSDCEVDGFSLAHFDVKDVFATGGIGRAELSLTQTPATKFFEGVDFHELRRFDICPRHLFGFVVKRWVFVSDALSVDGYMEFDGKNKEANGAENDQAEPIKWLAIYGVGDAFVQVNGERNTGDCPKYPCGEA